MFYKRRFAINLDIWRHRFQRSRPISRIEALESVKDSMSRSVFCEKEKLIEAQVVTNRESTEVPGLRATNLSLQVRLQESDETRVDDIEVGQLLDLAVKNSGRLADPTETCARSVLDAVLLSTVELCLNSVK